MIRRFTACLALALLSSLAMAQEKVTIKSGTIVPLQAVQEVRAKHVDEGQTVYFKVTRDVFADGLPAIPQGTLAKGKVTECRRSLLAGTPGALTIELLSVTLPSGDKVPFADSVVRIKGKNRRALSICLAVLIEPLILIPGTKAVMREGYLTEASVAENVTVTVE